MGVLSQAEYDQGMIGGEGEQHMQGIARSRSNPDVLYMAHDCAHLWRSGDNGLSWQRPSCEGLDVQAGESIEVDPLNPDRVFALVDNAYNYLLNSFRGLYRSTDGGETWTLVLQKDLAHVRCDQHRVAYDPASVSGGMAQRWYVAGADNAPGTGYTANNDAAIYSSDDGGDTWTKGASLVGHDWPAVIWCHPTDGQTLYVASDEGLLVSHDRGATLSPLGNLPSGRVSGLAVNPQSPNDVWAVVLHVGLYRST
ncbi:MAG: hypothetical protein JXL80_06670, partial [Planctomycetes bacterium]|nr:hypothetical protein [Planctomycetota bacterium]